MSGETKRHLIIGLGKNRDLTANEKMLREHRYHLSPSTYMTTVATGLKYRQEMSRQTEAPQSQETHLLYSTGQTSEGLLPEAGGMAGVQQFEFADIPTENVSIEISSKNTRQNAKEIARIIEERKKENIVYDRISLITVERHLPRAMDIFHAAGIRIDQGYASEEILQNSGEQMYQEFVEEWRKKKRLGIALDTIKEEGIRRVDKTGKITEIITKLSRAAKEPKIS